MIYIPLCIY